MTAWLTPMELGAWRRLVILIHQLPSRLTTTLAAHELGFFEYMMLAMLSDAPDGALSMGRVASLLSVSPSRLSHAARRMEARGLLTRETSVVDRRVTIAMITEQGQALLDVAAPPHVQDVRSLVFDALTEEQVEQLGSILSLLVDRVAPDVAPPWDENADW